MASVDVTGLHWESFARFLAQCNFPSLVQQFENRHTPFFKGLGLFRKRDDDADDDAMKRGGFVLNGARIEIKTEWFDDARKISRDLVRSPTDDLRLIWPPTETASLSSVSHPRDTGRRYGTDRRGDSSKKGPSTGRVNNTEVM